MKKLLKIIDNNRFIYFKNRKIRTPATLEVTNDDLKKLHIALRMADIQEFEVITIDENKIKEKIPTNIEENKNVIIEELEEQYIVIEEFEEEEPKTILEKLMRNEEEKWSK